VAVDSPQGHAPTIAIWVIPYPDPPRMLEKFLEDIVLLDAAGVTARYAPLLADAKISGVVPFGSDARGGLRGTTGCN
jgi:hypothetical protein